MAEGEAKVVALAVVLPLLAVAAVSARFYSRRLRHTELGIDDWLVVIGTILVIGLGIAQLVGAYALIYGVKYRLITGIFCQGPRLAT